VRPLGVPQRVVYSLLMSKKNGDRARFQKNRKRKLVQRERTRELLKSRHAKAPAVKAG
jgi:hypothetical protein